MFRFKKIALVSVALMAALSISCSETDPGEDEPGKDGDLVRNKFTLSYSGTSYGDLDGAKAYKQADVAGKEDKIDVVAYYTNGASDHVKNPCYVPTIEDECSPLVTLYSIPSKYHSALKTATKTSDIVDFLNAFADDEIGSDSDEEEEISISNGSAFLVFSSEKKFYAVVITSSGAQTVSLDFFNPNEAK